jgi:hypothetical protein
MWGEGSYDFGTRVSHSPKRNMVVSVVTHSRVVLVTCLGNFPDLRTPSADASDSSMVMIKFNIFNCSFVTIQQYTESEESLDRHKSVAY